MSVLFQYIDLLPYERGVLRRRGEAAALLGPGSHRLGWRFASVRVERLDLRQGCVRWTRELAELLDAQADTLEVGPGEVAVITHDGELAACVGEGRYLVWRALERVRVRVTLYTFDGVLTTLPEPLWASVPETHLRVVVVPDGEAREVWVDGARVATLDAGRYGVCCWRRRVEVRPRTDAAWRAAA